MVKRSPYRNIKKIYASRKITRKGIPFALYAPNEPRGVEIEDSNMAFDKQNLSVSGAYGDLVTSIFGDYGGVQKFGQAGTVFFKSQADEYGDNRAYLIDDTNPHWVRSSWWETFVSQHTVDEITIDYLYRMGATNNFGTSITWIGQLKCEQALEIIWRWFKEDKINIQLFIMEPPPRAFGGTHDEIRWIEFHKALTAVAARNDDIILGPEYKDADMRDSAHISDTGLQTKAHPRRANILGAWFGRVSFYGLRGPVPISATWQNDYLIITIEHDAGTDIVPQSGCGPVICIEANGTFYDASSVTKISQNQLAANFVNSGLDPIDIDEIHIARTSMNALPQTNAPFIYDNHSPPQPIRNQSLFPIVNDPTLNMELTYDILPGVNQLTLNGSSPENIESIICRKSKEFISASGFNGEYDSETRSILMPDESSGYRFNVGETGSAKHYIRIDFFLPETPINNGIICGTGSASSVQVTPRTSLHYDYSLNELQWLQNESSAVETLGAPNVGGWNCCILDFDSVSNCNFYLNSETLIKSFDPRDNMPTQTHFWFGGGIFSSSTALDGVSGAKFGRVQGRFGLSLGEDAQDATPAQIMQNAANRWGITLN